MFYFVLRVWVNLLDLFYHYSFFPLKLIFLEANSLDNLDLICCLNMVCKYLCPGKIKTNDWILISIIQKGTYNLQVHMHIKNMYFCFFYISYNLPHIPHLVYFSFSFFEFSNYNLLKISM